MRRRSALERILRRRDSLSRNLKRYVGKHSHTHIDRHTEEMIFVSFFLVCVRQCDTRTKPDQISTDWKMDGTLVDLCLNKTSKSLPLEGSCLCFTVYSHQEDLFMKKLPKGFKSLSKGSPFLFACSYYYVNSIKCHICAKCMYFFTHLAVLYIHTHKHTSNKLRRRSRRDDTTRELCKKKKIHRL